MQAHSNTSPAASDFVLECVGVEVLGAGRPGLPARAGRWREQAAERIDARGAPEAGLLGGPLPAVLLVITVTAALGLCSRRSRPGHGRVAPRDPRIPSSPLEK